MAYYCLVHEIRNPKRHKIHETTLRVNTTLMMRRAPSSTGIPDENQFEAGLHIVGTRANILGKR